MVRNFKCHKMICKVGGCSPVGMKKKVPAFIEAAALSQPVIAVSAGVRGCQMLLAPPDLVAFTKAKLCEVCRGDES